MWRSDRPPRQRRNPVGGAQPPGLTARPMLMPKGYVDDGPRLDTACPRYFGPACRSTGYARIDVNWTGPAALRVTMDGPALDWTVTVTSTRLLGFLNMISAAMPPASWRPRPLVWARERLASALGMGQLRLAGTMPSGQVPLPARGVLATGQAAWEILDPGRV